MKNGFLPPGNYKDDRGEKIVIPFEILEKTYREIIEEGKKQPGKNQHLKIEGLDDGDL